MVQGSTTHTGRRIGIVSYDFDPPIGGLGVLVKTYVDEMRKLFPDDQITVISPAAKADEFGTPLGRFRYLKSGGCPLFSIALFFSLPTLVRKHSFDLIHVHSGSGGVFLLRRQPCKVVVTAHHTYRQEADLVFRRNPLKRLWKLFMALFEARTYNLADAVICVSKDTADEIISQYGVAAAKVCVIENPVRIASSETLRSLPKNPDSILFVGRLEARKGILLLLKAFAMLKKEVPTAKLRLVGANLLGDKLDSIIRSLNLQGSVISLGYVHDPYRFRETAEATVMVVPSTLEGFGLVAAEAMVLGTCVVVHCKSFE
jgi:glycosyltransferase involved in cell wall biosynthesis